MLRRASEVVHCDGVGCIPLLGRRTPSSASGGRTPSSPLTVLAVLGRPKPNSPAVVLKLPPQLAVLGRRGGPSYTPLPKLPGEEPAILWFVAAAGVAVPRKVPWAAHDGPVASNDLRDTIVRYVPLPPFTLGGE